MSALAERRLIDQPWQPRLDFNLHYGLMAKRL